MRLYRPFSLKSAGYRMPSEREIQEVVGCLSALVVIGCAIAAGPIGILLLVLIAVVTEKKR